jgi:hypothetical protein
MMGDLFQLYAGEATIRRIEKQVSSTFIGIWSLGGGLAVAAHSPIDCNHFDKNQQLSDIFDNSANHMVLTTSTHM